LILSKPKNPCDLSNVSDVSIFLEEFYKKNVLPFHTHHPSSGPEVLGKSGNIGNISPTA
jgi:hypothetical protein